MALKVGIIGNGGIANSHMHGYLALGDRVEVVACCDINFEKAKEFAARYNIPNVYDNCYDMLRCNKLDMADVCTWNAAHCECTVTALNAGVNVLCEKPMAMKTAEAEKMLKTAKRCKKKLGIDFSYRFKPQSRAMKDMIEQGALGEIYYARSVWFRRRGITGLAANDFNTGSGKSAPMGSWFFDKKQSGGGPLIDLGVHRLDLALWLMGSPKPVWVMASTYTKFGDKLAKQCGQKYTVEDLACAMIKFDNGATLELDASWASNIKENELQTIRLLGDKGGMYQYNLNEGYTYDVEYYSEMAGRAFDSKMHTAQPVPSAYALFVDAVRDDTPFLVQPEDGVKVMKILDAIYRSAKTGAPEKIG